MYEYEDLVEYVTNNISDKKMVFIINGNGGSGKDYLINNLRGNINGLDFWNESVIDPVKLKAYSPDLWDGEKDKKGRILLNDMKKAFDRYNDFTSRYIINVFNSFMNEKEDADILFIHCGNLKQINTLKKLFISHCPVRTLFIQTPVKELNDDPRYNENDENEKNRDSTYYDLSFYNTYTHIDGYVDHNKKKFADLILSEYENRMNRDTD